MDTRKQTLRSLVRTALPCVILAAIAAPAAAQDGSDTAQPLGFEEIQEGFVVKPSLKLTEVDDQTGTLAGFSIGGITAGQLFVGGGMHWLVSDSDDMHLTYGGGVIEWFSNPDSRVKLSAGGLFGFGVATLDTVVGAGSGSYRGGRFSARRFGRHDGLAEWQRLGTVRLREDFYVFEPQANVVFSATDWLRVGVGAGFRLVGAADAFDDRLRGYTAQVGFHVGPL